MSTMTSSVSPIRPARSVDAVAPVAAQGRRGERVAVLLNANARNVSDRIRNEIARFIPAEDVFYSKTLDESAAHLSTILERGYTTILTGGGDGTFGACVTEVMHQLEEDQVSLVQHGNTLRKVVTRRRPIRFGVLHLGTGNSVAQLLGASSSKAGLVEDILRARAGDLGQPRKLHLLTTEGRLAPFAGMGTDARILNDYVRVRDTLDSTPFGRMASGVSGYLLSVTGLSIPATLMERKAAQVEVINEGAPAQQLGPDGAAVGAPIGTGEVIYRGPCRILAAGTVPSYGFGFTIFPHALRRPGRMQLRLTAMTTAELIPHIPAIWRGRTPCASILDFSVDKVRVSFDRPMPFQIGGDAEGTREKVSLAVAPQPVEMLDFKSHG